MTAPTQPDHLYYVGPIGSLLALPDVMTAVDATAERIGGVHTSLSGSRTIDTFGFSRSWSWSWDALLPWQVAYIDALQYGMTAHPLRLIDPRRTNRLPEPAAAGGSVKRSTEPFEASTGLISYAAMTTIPADAGTLPAAPLLAGAIKWVTAGGVSYLYPTDKTTSDHTWRTPVLPNQPLELSVWVTGTTGATVSLGWREYTQAGGGTAYPAQEVSLNSATWQKLTVTRVPATAMVAIAPVLTSTTSATVYAAAWQIAAVGAETLPPGFTQHCEITDQSLGWRPGGGAPVVAVNSLGRGYGRLGLQTGALTLLEVANSSTQAIIVGSDTPGGGSLPTSYLNVRDYGATGNGLTDDQNAVVNAIAAAKLQNKPLYFPPGTYVHSARLVVDGVVMFGGKPGTATLKGTTISGHAIDLRGTGPALYNLDIAATGKAPRTSDRGGNGVYGYYCTGYTIRNCHVYNVTGAGIMCENSSNGVVRNNLIEACGADGIFHTEDCHDIEVAYNRTVTTGDDAISVTGYDTPSGHSYNISIHHNSVIGNFESRAITVNGGHDISIYSNHVDGGTAGVTACAVTEWGTLPVTGNIDVYGNTLRNINQARFSVGTIGGGALHCYNDLATGTVTGVNMHDNQIYRPGKFGFEIAGTRPVIASILNNTFWMDATIVLQDISNTSPSTVITQVGTARIITTAYNGDLVSSTVGGIVNSYRYSP